MGDEVVEYSCAAGADLHTSAPAVHETVDTTVGPTARAWARRAGWTGVRRLAALLTLAALAGCSTPHRPSANAGEPPRLPGPLAAYKPNGLPLGDVATLAITRGQLLSFDVFIVNNSSQPVTVTDAELVKAPGPVHTPHCSIPVWSTARTSSGCSAPGPRQMFP